MSTREKLEQTLRGLSLSEIDVKISEDPNRWSMVAVVVSPGFASMDEADRQDMVWEAVMRDLTDDEQRQVEFIFTATPEEQRNPPEELLD